MRRTLPTLVALTLVLVASVGCGGRTGRGGDRHTDRTGSAARTADTDTDGDDGPAEQPDPGPSTTRPSTTRAAALTCAELEDAVLGSATARFNDYNDPILLRRGRWAGDGTVVALQPPCAIGDLTGDGVPDALRAVMVDGGGTGKFWSLVLWRNVRGEPAYVTTAGIGDRTPVESITISRGRARVVYLTRPDDAAMVESSIERTATYQLVGADELAEIGYTDVPRG